MEDGAGGISSTRPARKINLRCKEREEEKTGSEMKERIKRERKREKK